MFCQHLPEPEVGQATSTISSRFKVETSLPASCNLSWLLCDPSLGRTNIQHKQTQPLSFCQVGAF